eukprot:GILI01023124.1.p1 GENE.GILI01023124.1~~GILI01023124.1.p1  ORF type:complete len:172 (+),score=35.52 GILI01023124.1:70-516(+)
MFWNHHESWRRRQQRQSFRLLDEMFAADPTFTHLLQTCPPKAVMYKYLTTRRMGPLSILRGEYGKVSKFFTGGFSLSLEVIDPEFADLMIFSSTNREGKRGLLWYAHRTSLFEQGQALVTTDCNWCSKQNAPLLMNFFHEVSRSSALL